MSIGVTTLVAGRRTQLAGLLAGLADQTRPADRVVVVRMDDAPVELPAGLEVEIIDCAAAAAGLPLASARNAGVRALGTDRVILLDVDCIPLPGLVAGYAEALTAADGPVAGYAGALTAADGLVAGYAGASNSADGLVCGEVRYLPPDSPASLGIAELLSRAQPGGSRPTPRAGELIRDDLHALAWTTSLAFTRATFDRIGGFDERFVGYGGEDTDFTERARLAGVGVWWSGDALALHQNHGPSGVPRHQVASIVRNARLFQTLHGWWPMRGWLEQFAAERLVEFLPDQDVLRVVA